jgi:phosphoserine phosphatase
VSSKTSIRNLSSQAAAFIDSVLALDPQVIAFDCDGTLWSGDSGADFMYWEIEQKLLPEQTSQWLLARYKDYLAGKVSEEDMCGEMVQVHRGIPVAKIAAAAKKFFAEVVDRRIFPEMQELAHRLIDAGREVWAVSSTNDWVVIEGVKRFGIPAERVLAAAVKSADSFATDELIHIPSDEGKRTALRKVLKRKLDASFGNSIHDVAMLELAGHAFAINPNSDLAAIAEERGWTIYQPEMPR